MAFVFKVKCGDIMRRLSVKDNLRFFKPDISFTELESTIRRVFEIPVLSRFAILYTDTDNDEVTMTNDDDIVDACVSQNLNPLRLTVLFREEKSRSSAHDTRPPEPLTVDPPPWAADILLKLDQLLLSVNKPLVEPVVTSGSPTSTKFEDHFLVVDYRPNDGSTIEPAKDTAQSGSESEFLRRAAILRQRVTTDELSEVEDRKP